MSALSNYAENEVLDYLLIDGGTVYLALFESDPTDAGSGTELTETGYARQACAFDAASGGSTANTDIEEFTAGEDWPEVTHWGIFDAATDGNLLIHGAFTEARTAANGDTLRVAAGAITITAA